MIARARQAVLSAQRQRELSRRSITLGLVAVAHLALVVALLSLGIQPPIERPEIRIDLSGARAREIEPPLPPPPVEQIETGSASGVSKTVPSTKPTIITAQTTLSGPATQSTLAVESPEGAPGLTSGTPGKDGVASAVPSPPPAAAPAEAFTPGVGGVSFPELIQESKTEPVYPRLARRARAKGSAVLEIVVGEDGAVAAVTVIREQPAGLGFGDAATTAVLGWRYKPAERDGRPVPARVTVNVAFTLD